MGEQSKEEFLKKLRDHLEKVEQRIERIERAVLEMVADGQRRDLEEQRKAYMKQFGV